MGGQRSCFRAVALESDRSDFYILLHQLNVDQCLSETPRTHKGDRRYNLSFSAEQAEKDECRAVAKQFNVFEASVARLAYRIGIGVIVSMLQGEDNEEAEP